MNSSPAKSAPRRPAPPSGLGRGLARILEPPAPSERAEVSGGLDQLLGPISRSRGVQLRPFVLRAALTAVAESFRADGAVLVLRPGKADRTSGAAGAGEPIMITQLPPSWTGNDNAMFELHGRLWSLSQVQPESERTWSDQYRIDRHHAWMARLPAPDGPVGVAFVRTTRFEPAETHALERSMASAASALAPAPPWRKGDVSSPLCGGRSSKPAAPVGVEHLGGSTDPVFTASVSDDGDTVVAEVTVRRPDGFVTPVAGSDGSCRGDDSAQATLTGTGRGPDVATAVARAAGNACQPQYGVSFAGSLDVDGSTVTVVLVGGLDLDGRPPRLGVSIRPSGDVVGAAEAVFTAARAD